jgi:hypothetical protein
LRFSFVVAAYLEVRLPPQFLRALSRQGGRGFYEVILSQPFYGIINPDGFVKNPAAAFGFRLIEQESYWSRHGYSLFSRICH